MNNLVTQEEPMGCAIACVAMIINKSYKSTKKLFEKQENAVTKGYYCREIIEALKKKKFHYTFAKVNEKNKHLLQKQGTIVFIEKNKQYPRGHYLVKTKHGWTNPWVNYPNISPAKSGIQKKLPGKAQWVIYPIDQKM